MTDRVDGDSGPGGVEPTGQQADDSRTDVIDYRRLRVGLTIAVVGVLLALLFGILALVGPQLFESGYTIGIVLALIGLGLTAIVGSRLTAARFGVSITAVVIGVLIVGIGFDTGSTISIVAGILCVAVGIILTTRLDTQDPESSD